LAKNKSVPFFQLTLQVAQAAVTVFVWLFLEKPVIERLSLAGFMLLLGRRLGTPAERQADRARALIGVCLLNQQTLRTQALDHLIRECLTLKIDFLSMCWKA